MEADRLEVRLLRVIEDAVTQYLRQETGITPRTHREENIVRDLTINRREAPHFKIAIYTYENELPMPSFPTTYPQDRRDTNAA